MQLGRIPGRHKVFRPGSVGTGFLLRPADQRLVRSRTPERPGPVRSQVGGAGERAGAGLGLLFSSDMEFSSLAGVEGL